jgi:predicted esterase YcpF (UPF0227 family)
VIVYLHGFNSSPQSHKAQLLARHLEARGLRAEYACPALPPLASDAVGEIEKLIKQNAQVAFVGSSLGGFYATYLAEKHAAKAVLINPAIDPGEAYELTEAHLRAWQQLYIQRITPERYLLLVETGDEVLDYRRALARYAGAEQVVIQGGDHSLASFPQHLPRILEFSGLRG